MVSGMEAVIFKTLLSTAVCRFKVMKWSLCVSILCALETFLLLHDATLIKRETKSRIKISQLFHQYSISSNEHPFEYISQLFGVCSEAQNPSVMREAHLRAQRFFSETEIIRRARHPATYFRQIPSEGLRKVRPSEEKFPLAFVHLVHEDVGIFEMFLAIMYRPHNFHCVHVDVKATQKTKKAVEAIVEMYQIQFETQNIFLSSENIPVYWAHISVIDAELICLQDLLSRPAFNWHYVLTTAGSELPISSHSSLRSELEAANNKDIFVSAPFPYRHLERFNESHDLERFGPGKYDLKINLKGNGKLKGPPPNGIQMFKGYKNVALTRKTANFIAHHEISKNLRNWLSDTLIPDESFYATLARIRNLDPDEEKVIMDEDLDSLHGLCTRFSLWRNFGSCAGEVIRHVCNFGFGDLYDVWNSDCWMANKFSLQVDANAIVCHVKHMMELNKYN